MRTLLKQMAVLLAVSQMLLGVDSAAMDEARQLFKNKQYDQAYARFKELFLEDMASKEVNFYLGRSAYESGRYQAAISAYERVLFADPDDLKSRFELGRSYFSMRMMDQAEVEFNDILVRPIQPEIRKRVQQYIQKIAESRQRHVLGALLSFSFQDDTNINNGNDYTTGLVNPTVSDRSFLASMRLQHTYNLASDKAKTWVTKANLYEQRNYTASDYNIDYPYLQTGLQHTSKDVRYYFPIGYESLKFGEMVRFNAYSLGAEADYILTPERHLSLKSKLQSKTYYAATDIGRDAYIVSLSGRYTVGRESKYFLYLGADIEREQTKDRPNNDVENNAVRLGGGYQHKIDKHSMLYASYYLRHRKDLEASTLTETHTRSDLTHTATVSYVRSLEDDRSFVTLYALLGKGESNHDIYDYDKTVYGVSYTISLGHDDLIPKAKGE